MHYYLCSFFLVTRKRGSSKKALVLWLWPSLLFQQVMNLKSTALLQFGKDKLKIKWFVDDLGQNVLVPI